MKFLDASVVLHAMLDAHRSLSGEEQALKRECQKIMLSVEHGEQVETTTIHVSETLNIVETRLGQARSLNLLAFILSSSNIRIHEVTQQDYGEALLIARTYRVGANDALAYAKMKASGLEEVYTTDRHFAALPDVKPSPLKAP